MSGKVGEVSDVKQAVIEEQATAEDQTQDGSQTSHPGQRLRAAREAAGMEQEDIAGELRLDLKLIRALEEGDLEQLPEPVFTAGYIRSYARLLGLPADAIVAQYLASETRDLPGIDSHARALPERYRKVANGLPDSFSLSTGQQHKAQKSRQQGVWGILLVVAIVTAGLAAAYWLKWPYTAQVAKQAAPKQTAPVQDKTANAEALPETPATVDANMVIAQAKPAPANDVSTTGDAAAGNLPADNTAANNSTAKTERPADGDRVEKSLSLKPLPGTVAVPPAGGADAAPAAPDLTQLSLRFSGTSWVDIRDATGKRLIRELGLKGATKTIEGVAPFKVLLGYGRAVEIEYNGQPFDFSKYQGDRVARFTLHVADKELNAHSGKDPVSLPEPADD